MIIIFGNDHSWLELCYNNGNKMENVEQDTLFIAKRYPYIGNSKFIAKVCQAHTHWRINRYYSVPLKQIWYKKIINNLHRGDENLTIIVYDGSYIACNVDFFDYLKTKFPNTSIKKVYYFTTLVKYSFAMSAGFFEKLKSQYDNVYTYDINDANRYSIKYIEDIIYIYNPMQYMKNALITKSDLFYIGNAKIKESPGRFERIMQIYFECQKKGIKTEFLLSGVPKEKQILGEGISYIDTIAYTDVIGRLLCSRCILEIVQNEQVGETLRTSEAIIFNKKLLTDNKSLANRPFYASSWAKIMNESFNDSYIDFIKNEVELSAFPKNIVKDISCLLNSL